MLRKWFCILLCLGFLAGCQPAEQVSEPLGTPEDVYIWEDVGATILLPTGTMEHCEATVRKDSGAGVIWFTFKDGGDAAFWLKAYGKDSDSDSPVAEEQLGVFTLGETNTHIIQVMTSTCGTLNNEKIRSLWDEMRQKAWKMTEENIIIFAE